MSDLRYPRTPHAAIQHWRIQALHAEELRVELNAAKAVAYIETAIPDSVKATDAIRESYSMAQTAELAKRAAAAAVEAKAAERWANFVVAFLIVGGEISEPGATDGNK